MITSYAVGILAVVGLSVGWVAVQRAWRRTFPAEGPETDALAGRPGCAGCDHREGHACGRDGNGTGRAAPACGNRGTSSGAREGVLS